MTVSKSLRHQVMRRDNYTCRYCGAQAPDVKLTIDHVTPVTLGGSDQPNNLVTACADCNTGKSANPPDAALVADIDQRAVEWSQAMQVAIERRSAELAAERGSTEPFNAAWSRWTNAVGEVVPRDANWRSSILRFLAAGLNDQFFEDAINTAMGQDRIPATDKWKYFCGICWREVDALQKIARAVAGTPASTSMVSTGDPEWDDAAQLAEGFPFMEMIGLFVDDLMGSIQLDERAQRIARKALWESMSRVNDVWLSKSFGDADDDAAFDAAYRGDAWADEEGPTRYDFAVEAMGIYPAYDMHQIALIVREGRPT